MFVNFEKGILLMIKTKVLATGFILSVLFLGSFSSASGKQFRPPKSDPCKVNAESEKCKDEKKQVEK